MDKDKKNQNQRPSGLPSDSPVHNSEMEELYRRLQPEMRRPKPNPDAIAAALEAAQRLAAEADAEQAADDAAQELGGESNTIVCGVCGYRNREGNKFCGMCGITVTDSEAAGSGSGADDVRPSRALTRPLNSFLDHEPEGRPPTTRSSGQETHHYHHHYHHHYFPGGEAMAARSGADAVRDPIRDPLREDKFRPTAALRGDMSRAEAAVRRVAQEWVLACNTKHLDDLLDLYVADALVLRSNCAPVRGARCGARIFLWRTRRWAGRGGIGTAARGSRRRSGLRSGTLQGLDSRHGRQAPRRARQVSVGLRAPS